MSREPTLFGNAREWSEYGDASMGLPADAILCSTLLSERTLLESYLLQTGERWVTDRELLMASFFLKGYVSRLASVAVGQWVASKTQPSLRAENVLMSFAGGRPAGMWLRDTRPLPLNQDGLNTAISRVLIEEHVSRLVANLRTKFGGGSHWWWGNVAGAIAGAWVEVARGLKPGPLRDSVHRSAANQLADVSPLAGLGSYYTDERGDLAFRRSACCLYFVVDPELCDDCNRVSLEKQDNASWTEGGH